jgi:radical SAM protein with 4Fe4S-binding SPASM domain
MNNKEEAKNIPSNITKFNKVDTEKLLYDHLYHRYGNRFLDYRKRYFDSINYKSYGKELNYPNQVILELVNRCNLECVMCYQGYRNDTKKYTLSDDDLVELFKDFKKNKLNSLLISISEPLLYKNIEKVFDLARDADIMDILLFTNGTLLNEKNSLKILNSTVTRLFVSIDAFTPEAYNKVRIPVTNSIKNSDARIKKLEENIKNFINLRNQQNKKFPLVRTSFVALKENEKEIDSFTDKWVNIVDSVEVQKEVSINAYEDIKKFNQSELFEYAKKGQKKYECRQPWTTLGVYSDGSVTPCCNTFGRNLPIGNIKDNSVSEIWKSELIENVRSGFEKNTPCNGCKICIDNTSE